MASPSENAGSAYVRAERTLANALFLFRAGGIAEILLAASLDFARYPAGTLGLVIGLIVLVTAESTALVVACQRAGRVPAAWILADVPFCTAALVAGAVLTAPRDYYTWANFMYPFTIITSFGIGAGLRRLPATIGMTAVLAVGYLASAVLVHGEPPWNVLPNSLTYYANAIVAWAVSRHLLVGGIEIDRNRAEAVERAAELAREREHSRQARLLHDRVLQTLETLAKGRWVTDADFRTHIAAEAAWLRAHVEGIDLRRERDLLAALQLLVQHSGGIGLHVELNVSRLREDDRWRTALRPEAVEAVTDATREALTNVAKHAGVDSAVVRAGTTETELTVSVLDHGRGFDPATVRHGIGLDRSIQARIAEAGGHTRIESAPDAGTYIELVVPFDPAPLTDSSA